MCDIRYCLVESLFMGQIKFYYGTWCGSVKFLVSRICSIQICLTSLFSLALVTLGIAIITVFSLYSKRNILEIFDDRQSTLLEYSESHFHSWLSNGPEILNQLEGYLVGLSREDEIDLLPIWGTENNLDTIKRVQRMTYSLANKVERIDWVFYGSRIGSGIGSTPLVSGYMNDSTRPEECCNYTIVDLIVGVRDDLPDGLQVRRIFSDFTFGPYIFVGLNHSDFRLSPWYRLSESNRNDTAIQWASNQVSSFNEITSTVVKNVHDDNGEFVGVVQCSFFMENVNSFLRSLELEQGIIFAIDQRDGTLLGTSYEEGKVTIHTTDELTQLSVPVSALEVEDSVLSQASQHILSLSSQDDFSEISSIERENVLINDRIWFLEATSFEVEGGFRILQVHVVSEDSVFSEINRVRKVCLYICIGKIVLFSLVTSLFIFCLLRPLVTLSSRMKKVEKMDLEKARIRFLSFFYEIRNVQKRFRFCVMKLKEYRSFLPESVLRGEFNDEESEEYMDQLSSSTDGKEDDEPRSEEEFDIVTREEVKEEEEDSKSEETEEETEERKNIFLTSISTSSSSSDEEFDIKEEREEVEGEENIEDVVSNTSLEILKRKDSFAYKINPSIRRISSHSLVPSHTSSNESTRSSSSSNNSSITEVGRFHPRKIMKRMKQKRRKSRRSSSTTTTSTSTSTKRRFRHGLKHRMIICVYFHLDNWKQVYVSDPKNFCGTYGDFFEKVSSTFLSSGGNLHLFEIDRIIFHFSRSQTKQVFKNVQRIEKDLNSGRYVFRVTIGVSYDLTLTGVIGLENHEKASCVLHDGAVKNAKFMIHSYQQQQQQGGNNVSNDYVSVLVDSRFEWEVRNNTHRSQQQQQTSDYILMPYNIYYQISPTTTTKKKKTRKKMNRILDDCVVVYKMIDHQVHHQRQQQQQQQERRKSVSRSDSFHFSSPKKNNEWMYVLERNEKKKNLERVRNSFNSLLNQANNQSFLKNERQSLIDCVTINNNNNNNDDENSSSNNNNILTPNNLLRVFEMIVENDDVGSLEELLLFNIRSMERVRPVICEKSALFFDVVFESFIGERRKKRRKKKTKKKKKRRNEEEEEEEEYL